MQDLMADIAAFLAGRVRQAARRQMGRALLVGFALLFVGIAIVAGVAAIGVALATRWGAMAACLIIAVAALMPALVLLVVVAQQAKAARRRWRAELAQLQEAAGLAKAILPHLTTSSTLLIATALGLMVGLTAGKQSPQDKS